MAAERGRVTRADVAQRAGVAPSTVSLVLNGRAEQVKLAPQTVRRVERAARELHYVPSAAARRLRHQRSRTIGLLLGRPEHSPIVQDVIAAAVDAAHKRGHFVLLLPSLGETKREVLDAIRDADLAGVICQGHLGGKAGTILSRSGLPTVWIAPSGHDLPSRGDGSAQIDIRPGVQALAELGHQRGHRSVGILAGPGKIADDRYAPIFEVYGEKRVRVETADGWMIHAGLRAAQRLLARRSRPTFIYCANDMLAADLLHVATSEGLRIPDDLAVAGFGNFPFGADLTPALTTVDWPLRTLAHRGVEILLDHLDQPEGPRSDATLATELVVRASL